MATSGIDALINALPQGLHRGADKRATVITTVQAYDAASGRVLASVGGDPVWLHALEPGGGGRDTGWVNITIASGFAAWSNSPPQVRRIGAVVHVRGGWSNTGLAANQSNATVGTLPPGFAPPISAYFAAIGQNLAVSGRFGFNAAGAVRLTTASTLASYYLAFGSWVVDAAPYTPGDLVAVLRNPWTARPELVLGTLPAGTLDTDPPPVPEHAAAQTTTRVEGTVRITHARPAGAPTNEEGAT